MAGAQAVWGIDLGRCALKAIRLRTGAGGKVDILAHDYIEHAKILTQPDANRTELIGSALEKFLSRNDLSKDQVVVGVPGQHTLARFSKLPPVGPKRIPDIVRYEADQQIPFDLDEVIWDYQTFQQEGMPDLEVGIFAMKRELIREHLLHFEQAMIEPIVVQSGPLAVYNAAHVDGILGGETTVLLDIGAGNTDLIIATTDTFWTRTVPIGGNRLTEAVAKSFKLSFEKAEQLKRTAATSKYARQVFQAMQSVLADLVQELQRSIGYYCSMHREATVDRAIAVGNATQLPGLQKFLQQNLGLDVTCPDSLQNAVPAGLNDESSFNRQLPAYFGAYGLAAQGLDLAPVRSNLLPAEMAKQAVWRKKRPAFAAAAACLMLAGGLVWFRQVADMRAVAGGTLGQPAQLSIDEADRIIEEGPPPNLAERDKAQRVLDAGTALRNELRKLSGQGDGERLETEQLIDIQRNKLLALHILDVIHRSVPRGVLGKAETPEEIQAALSTAPKREDRKLVTIEEVSMQFEPDLTSYDWTSLLDVFEPYNDPDAGGGKTGFRVKIVCRTPNKGGASFVRDHFVNTVLREGRSPETGFYFDRSSVIAGNKVVSGQRSASSGRFGGTQPHGGSVAKRAAQTDPLTLESIERDWEVEIWFSVVVEDFPGDPEVDVPAAAPE